MHSTLMPLQAADQRTVCRVPDANRSIVTGRNELPIIGETLNRTLMTGPGRQPCTRCQIPDRRIAIGAYDQVLVKIVPPAGDSVDPANDPGGADETVGET